ncbi:hypothetical protein [Polyangium sp. 6x1]|uniref:hypothetical protein n=1 Tax=Polyangium sp. 6x1 TaxID=3042689 RepID=UPI002482717F|nr:hypothetical protein [Polyangium sp. 6x1]MDI1443559.1 hypothetical protein [Polyangium sp. 6x1]
MNIHERRLSMVAPFLVMLACFAGCGGPEPDSNGSSGGGGSGGSGGSGASGGMGGMGGMGGAGTGGTSSSSSSNGSSSSSGTGGVLNCNNGMVVDEPDASKRCKDAPMGNQVVNAIPKPDKMVWADEVVEVSSEYQPVDWSSKQALGAPDVYPAGVDAKKAWATFGLDNPDEFLTVGFKTPVIGEAVWVYETYNPGAISKITITTSEGDKVIYENPNPSAIGSCAHVLAAPTQTCAPISAVRIDLASEKVDLWNEIDAVGILPPPIP